jgi:23S rRNA (adenine2503-C2)-methyltransferase
MRMIASTGKDEIALVYIVELDSGKKVECAESVQPPHPREDKWVLLVSTMFGCPVGCAMCDAGGFFQGRLTAEEILSQIDFMARRRFPDGRIPARQLKIQFARMGEPTLNPAVLEVLDKLPQRIGAPGLMPSVSTVAPAGSEAFLERLLEIKREQYPGGRFQFQFSLHTTDAALRDKLIPVRKWSFSEMAEYGERFHESGDRKITLNFALARGNPIDPDVLLRHFSPEKFLIKITPINPTYRAMENRLSSAIDPCRPEKDCALSDRLQSAGYTVIISIGEVEENRVGSNCGQVLRTHLEAEKKLTDGYTYPLGKSGMAY